MAFFTAAGIVNRISDMGGQAPVHVLLTTCNYGPGYDKNLPFLFCEMATVLRSRHVDLCR